ncbi:hypothetical protein PR202_ga21479 [Eleusine coracana subsp. coracana]|uniref:Uncharacterized protein n=1 Tax=Eleusine coracana subsp. coracana TaxID=191504 RepID=A0AAV5D0Q9_ELECO|nr:hypothetical protein PR202_ga21479 [Eleusine coracana subsp. coracana]
METRRRQTLFSLQDATLHPPALLDDHAYVAEVDNVTTVYSTTWDNKKIQEEAAAEIDRRRGGCGGPGSLADAGGGAGAGGLELGRVSVGGSRAAAPRARPMRAAATELELGRTGARGDRAAAPGARPMPGDGGAAVDLGSWGSSRGSWESEGSRLDAPRPPAPASSSLLLLLLRGAGRAAATVGGGARDDAALRALPAVAADADAVTGDRREQPLPAKARARAAARPAPARPWVGPICRLYALWFAYSLEKSWAMQDRKHLDALIARAFYSGGIPFSFARNPYLTEAFIFATTCALTEVANLSLDEPELQAVSFGDVDVDVVVESEDSS